MPSTTKTCKFCGKEMPLMNSIAFGRKTFSVYDDCDCEESVAEREAEAELERQQSEYLERKKRTDAYLRAGIKPRYLDATDERSTQIANQLLSCESLYIWGSFGTGKTYLASAAARELIDRGIRVKMLTGIEISQRLQATFGTKDSELDVLEQFSKVPVLIIDDLGKEPPSDWVLSRLFAIVNSRYDAVLPVVITTNYSRGELIERLGRNGDHDTAEALVSRLCEMGDTIRLDGKDRRIA